jgi:hypothetical protein
VAVDLYDGCLVYDIDRRVLRLIDLDTYREGPYVLDVDRQFGSTSVMAPEEFVRGTTIDHRTTVYTLVGKDRLDLPRSSSSRAGVPGEMAGQRQHVCRAPQGHPNGTAMRFRTVADLQNAWEAAAKWSTAGLH